MNFIRQFFGVLRINLLSAAQRMAPAITIIVGVACAVGVLVSMLAMGIGIPRSEAVSVGDLPGIKKDGDGAAIVVFESLIPIEGRRRMTGTRVFFPLVGATANLSEYRPEIHLTDGRAFRPGLHELLGNNACRRQFTGFEIGDRRSIRGIDWIIVGHFDEGHTLQCIVYADVDILMSTFNRNTYSEVSVMLQSPADFAAFRGALQANPALHLEVLQEREAVLEDFNPLKGVLDFASYFVGTIMAIGATLGAVNTLYAIIDSRRREFGTLRAIGFGSGAIVASMLCESLLFAIPGALLGTALAWIFFNGLSASPFGYSFQLAVTPSLGLIGIVWALAMGLAGGLLPALRAARLPVATALRAT